MVMALKKVKSVEVLKTCRGFFASDGFPFPSVSLHGLCSNVLSHDPFCNPSVSAGFNLRVYGQCNLFGYRLSE